LAGSRYNDAARDLFALIDLLLRTRMIRLGDVIDDYCPRCKLLLNHAVASLVDVTVVKVVCQTCHSEHPFKDAVVPVKKKSGPRATLLAQVLSKAAPSPAEVPVETVEEQEPEPPPKKKRAATPARYITRHAAPTPQEASADTAEEPTPPAKKERAATPARYITRHATRPPRGTR
jgi:hypothetical protein